MTKKNMLFGVTFSFKHWLPELKTGNAGMIGGFTVQNVCIWNTHFNHVKENLEISDYSPHKSGIWNSPLVWQINTTHVFIIRLITPGLAKSLFSQVPVTLTEHWTTLWSVSVVGVVAKTLTGFQSRHVTHVTLLCCLNKLSPLLRCFTFLSFRPQISFGRPDLLDLPVPHARVFLSSSSSNKATPV